MKFVTNEIPTHIGFDASYVTELLVQPDSIKITADFALGSDHPLYTPIHPGEQCCFRVGIMIITGFYNLQWMSETTLPAFDADGKSWDFDYFTNEGDTWILGGDWGEIRVAGGGIVISLEWIDCDEKDKR